MTMDQEDWLRTKVWDIRDADGREVQTIEGLKAAIAPMTIDHFLLLPAAKAMPPELRQAIVTVE